jgi:hypothetical protein
MTTGMEIHRLLDEAFAGIDVTAEVQDLKEEMRGNLAVRVAELEESGLPADVAARRAVAELGDVRSIVDDTRSEGRPAPPWARNRVRPRPAYVVRTVVLSIFGVAALAAVGSPWLGATVALGWRLAAIGVVAVFGGVVVADGLRQETTTSYPVPRPRALGYGAATVLALGGIGAGSLYLRDEPLAFLVGGGIAVLLAVVGYTYLGTTQTNRHKPWVVRMGEGFEGADRFQQDPAAAARFGLYTVATWIVALTAFGVLSFTVGWGWSWLALVGGMVVMLLTLARMLFGQSTVDIVGNSRS